MFCERDRQDTQDVDDKSGVKRLGPCGPNYQLEMFQCVDNPHLIAMSRQFIGESSCLHFISVVLGLWKLLKFLLFVSACQYLHRRGENFQGPHF